MTNADKIRNLTDEELAGFLLDLPFAFDEHLWNYPSANGKWYNDRDEARKNNIEWLQLEAKE